MLDDNNAMSFELLQMIICHIDKLLQLHENTARPFAYVMDRRGRLRRHPLNTDNDRQG